jgi:copper chaperone CopZ
VKNDRPALRQGVLDVDGAQCPSCAFTIEKLGRRVPGVSEVRLDVARHEIRVDYDGSPGTLERIAGIVDNLGYSATVRRT